MAQWLSASEIGRQRQDADHFIAPAGGMVTVAIGFSALVARLCSFARSRTAAIARTAIQAKLQRFAAAFGRPPAVGGMSTPAQSRRPELHVSVSRSNHRLFLVDEGAGHRQRGIAQQKRRQAGDIVRLDETTERHRGLGFLEPAGAAERR